VYLLLLQKRRSVVPYPPDLLYRQLFKITEELQKIRRNTQG